MNKNQIVAVLLVIVGAVLVIPLTLQMLNSSGILTGTQAKQLDSVEILETQDLTNQSPRFKLHVQALSEFSSNPQKLRLIEKSSNAVKLELPLVKSDFVNECVTQDALLDKMVKWDTEWFTVNTLGTVDSTYNSKLTDSYSVVVVYSEGTSTKLYSSSNSIAGVCYQVPEATKSTPAPGDNIKED